MVILNCLSIFLNNEIAISNKNDVNAIIITSTRRCFKYKRQRADKAGAYLYPTKNGGLLYTTLPINFDPDLEKSGCTPPIHGGGLGFGIYKSKYKIDRVNRQNIKKAIKLIRKSNR